MYRILTILFLLFTIKTSTSQFYGRKHQPLMELNGTYSMSGWFISPGLSYMLPNKIKWLGGQENPDIKPRGRIGLYLELGRYHIFPEGGAFFNYMDYSIAFKRLSGSEIDRGSKNSVLEGELLFANHCDNIHGYQTHCILHLKKIFLCQYFDWVIVNLCSKYIAFMT